MLNDAPVNVRTLFEISNCRSAFSFASPKENAGSSEPASSERAPAIRGVSYPLSPFLPLQIASASLVCNLRTGGISISPRSPLEPTRKTASVFLDFSRDNKNGVEIWQTARPMRIRTAWQVLNAKLICRIHSNAAAYKFGVP